MTTLILSPGSKVFFVQPRRPKKFAHAFEAPARLAAVGVRDVDPQERVRIRPLELDDLAFELLVRLRVEHAERVMRLGARRPRRERENAEDAAEHEATVAPTRERDSWCLRSLLFLEAQVDAGLAVVGREVAVVLLAHVLGERPVAMTAVARPCA